MRRRALTVYLSGIVTLGLVALFGSSLGAPAGAATRAVIPTPPALVAPTTWTLGSIPSPTTTNTVQLAAATCATGSFCVAVGNQGNSSGGSTTLIEQWNGTKWTIVTSPNANPTGQNQLYGVSCAGPSFCVAVGVSGPGSTFVDPLVEQWNGSTWSLVTAVNPPSSPGTQLNDVSCPSSTSCIAVGYSETISSNRVVLVETWNGTAWMASGFTPPTVAKASELSAISCVTASSCMAVGNYTNASSDTLSLAATWNGTAWTVVPTPNPGAGTSGQFNSVSCAGSSFCVGVGQWFNGSVFQDLMETWNGSTWSNVTVTETVPAAQNFLDSVSCISATSCGVVGQQGVPNASPVALSWNGVSWSMATAPAPPGFTSASLSVITCVNDWQCIALGANGNTNSQPYVATAPVARSGYRFVATDGGIFSYGKGAPFLGSMGGQHLNKPIVGMGVMPAGDGYDLVASDGGIFSYGSAQFYGSTGAMRLNAPVVGMAMTADGGGYWLVATDGGIFSYGDAQFFGSTGSLHLNKPIVGMTATADGKGYWLVASDGGIFSFGDAAFYGSMGGKALNQPIVGMAAPTAGGYYLVASDGGIFTFPGTGVPPFQGSTGSLHLNKPIVGMTTAGSGYYLSGSDGGVFAFPETSSGPPFLGSTGSITLNAPIVGITA